jgi:hypothetical protein
VKPTIKKVGPRPSVNMEGVYLERKCHYIGMWKDDTVADNIIRQVADKFLNLFFLTDEHKIYYTQILQ